MLGVGEYAVTIAEWGGRILWQSTVSTLGRVSWARERNEVTKATMEAVVPSHTAHLLEPWIHLMQVHRDDELVWEGIVLRVETSWNLLRVEAADAAVMYSRRRVPHDRAWRQHDASQVMRTMVEDALGYRDPTRLTESIVSHPSRLWITASWTAAECMVEDVIDDLVDQGLAWCVSSGRLLVGPVAAQYVTAQLSDRDFDAGMTIVKDGTEVVTDALVTGKGIWGQYAEPDSPLGLVQALESADGAVRSAEAEEVARRIVQDAARTPRRLTVPSGSRLLPTTPIDLGELVPGVQVPVASRQTGVVVSSMMQLTALDVDVDSGGETVKITLEETTITSDVPELPDPADLDWRSPYERELDGTQRRGVGSGAPTGEDEAIGIPPA